MNGWIGVDLDGTLAFYDGWISVEHIGEPILPMVARVKQWLADGRQIKIFTARCDPSGHGDHSGAVHHVEQWCLKHLGVKLPVTNVKDMHMIELWDDRAVQVELNVGNPVGYSTRKLA